MSGRVLNFFEFSDKYSTGNSDPLGMDNIAKASSNFEEGFDDSTYDQPELGPKRPVSGEYSATPASPGENGAPRFSPGPKSGMEAPEMPEEDDEEEVEDDDSGNPEEGEEDESEEVTEGFRLVKGFNRFVNESYDAYSEEEEDYPYSDEYDDYSGDEIYSDEYGMNPEAKDPALAPEDDYGMNPEDSYGMNPEAKDPALAPEDDYGMNPEAKDPSMMDAGMYPEDDEDYDDYSGDEMYSDEYGMNPEDSYGMNPDDDQFCSSCGAVMDEYGYNCGCNM